MTTTHEPDADALESGIAAASQPSSRRGMLKLAGAVAVGAAATVAMKSGQAAAATGGNLTIGGANLATNVNEDITYLTGPFHAQTTTTLSTYQNTTGVNVGWNWVNAANGLTHAGVLGVATRFPLFPSGTAVGNGVVGLAGDNTTGAGVYANSSSTAAAGTSPGLKARSTNGPAALLVPVATGAPTTGTWAQGSLQPDTTGALWYCTAAGSPGTWINIAAAPVPFPSGSLFHAIAPTRVYDSRSSQPSQGSLSAGGTRPVSVKDARSLDTGAVTTADIVPAGTVAVTANVTVVNTVGAGFLAVNPGGDTEVKAATVNWYATGQILNNGVNLSLNATTREVTVIAGGGTGAATDFVIDVTGYYV